MDPFIYAFVISLGAGAISSLTLALLWKSAQKALVEERAAHAATSQNLVATQAAVRLSETGRSGEEVRLEEIIVALKAELANVKNSDDPEEQRKRLERLGG